MYDTSMVCVCVCGVVVLRSRRLQEADQHGRELMAIAGQKEESIHKLQVTNITC